MESHPNEAARLGLEVSTGWGRQCEWRAHSVGAEVEARSRWGSRSSSAWSNERAPCRTACSAASVATPMPCSAATSASASLITGATVRTQRRDFWLEVARLGTPLPGSAGAMGRFDMPVSKVCMPSTLPVPYQARFDCPCPPWRGDVVDSCAAMERFMPWRQARGLGSCIPTLLSHPTCTWLQPRSPACSGRGEAVRTMWRHGRQAAWCARQGAA